MSTSATKQLAYQFSIEASRVSAALRSVARVLPGEDITLSEGIRDGLVEAVAIMGDHIEDYAASHLDLAGHFDRSPCRKEGAL